MRAYFPSKADSPYYNTDAFQQALGYLKNNFGTCEIVENKGKLSMRIKNINSIEGGLGVCKEITQ